MYGRLTYLQKFSTLNIFNGKSEKYDWKVTYILFDTQEYYKLK